MKAYRASGLLLALAIVWLMGGAVVADANPAGTTISVAWSAVSTTMVRTPSAVLPPATEQATASRVDPAIAITRASAPRHRTRGTIGRQR